MRKQSFRSFTTIALCGAVLAFAVGFYVRPTVDLGVQLFGHRQNSGLLIAPPADIGPSKWGDTTYRFNHVDPLTGQTVPFGDRLQCRRVVAEMPFHENVAVTRIQRLHRVAQRDGATIQNLSVTDDLVERAGRIHDRVLEGGTVFVKWGVKRRRGIGSQDDRIDIADANTQDPCDFGQRRNDPLDRQLALARPMLRNTVAGLP